MKIVCFDLEGPLSPQDNAYDVMGILVENGHRIFEVLSRYDDVLTLEGRKGYEPGDTLSLIIPLLLYHGITEADIKKVSQKAMIVEGVKETIAGLKKAGFDVFIISTSYQPHAYNVGSHVGVGLDHIYCTKLPLDEYIERFKDSDFSLIKDVEKKILSVEDEEQIHSILDNFYWHELPEGEFSVIRDVKVTGGQRKVDAMKDAAKRAGAKLSDVIAVGDSITDFKMLREVRRGGGVAVAFNGNEYSVPYANIGLSSSDMRPLLQIAEAFSQGGKKEAMERAEYLEKNPDKINIKCGFAPRIQCLMDADKEAIRHIICTHKKARAFVRGAAAKLG